MPSLWVELRERERAVLDAGYSATAVSVGGEDQKEYWRLYCWLLGKFDLPGINWILGPFFVCVLNDWEVWFRDGLGLIPGFDCP